MLFLCKLDISCSSYCVTLTLVKHQTLSHVLAISDKRTLTASADEDLILPLSGVLLSDRSWRWAAARHKASKFLGDGGAMRDSSALRGLRYLSLQQANLRMKRYWTGRAVLQDAPVQRGQRWSGSAFWKLVAGLACCNHNFSILVRDSHRAANG